MLRILDRAAINAGTADSRIGFATEGGGAWKIWDRFLTVDGNKVYHLGNICQTCQFSFRTSGRGKYGRQYRKRSRRPRSGCTRDFRSRCAQLVAGLPNDDYLVCLSEATLQLVIPGQLDDYFVKEQVALWGIDQFWNLPHDPRVPYYRAGEANLGNRKKLIHFVIPMFPRTG
jgi:hypothetical protein